MKRQLIYFLVFIYGMVTLIAVGKKQNTVNTPKISKASFGAIIKEDQTLRARKFYGSNYNFAFRFSNNVFSYLY